MKKSSNLLEQSEEKINIFYKRYINKISLSQFYLN